MTAPDAALQTGDLTGGGRVTVVVSDIENNGVVILNDAPPPGPDRVYEFWLVPEGGGTPVYFRVHSAEDIRRVLDLSAQYSLRPIILGGQEAWQVAGRLKAANVPVLVSL